MKNKIPQEMEDQINTLYTASENIKNNIEKFLMNLNHEFDTASHHSAMLWFHELAAFCKRDVEIIADSLKQIQTIQEIEIKLKSPSLKDILDNMPKALDRLERYIEYFSTIKEEDLLVWDTKRLWKVRYGNNIPDELDK